MMIEWYMASLDEWLLGLSLEEGEDEDWGGVRMLRIGLGLITISLVLKQ